MCTRRRPRVRRAARPPTDLDDFRPLFDPDRFLLACDPDDGAIVGVTGDFPFDVTLPGGAALPVPGVTWVSVAVTHRRRGILRALLTEQHRGFVAAGAAVSLLTASEGGIYGRFGYGTATVHRSVEIDAPARGVPRRTRRTRAGSGWSTADEIRKLAPPIHRRWAAITPGALSRSDAWWDAAAAGPRAHAGTAALRCSTSRIPTATPRTGSAATTTRLRGRGGRRGDRGGARRAVADPARPRSRRDGARLRPVRPRTRCPTCSPTRARCAPPGCTDGMWARILDVPAALAARRYAVEIDVRARRAGTRSSTVGGRFRLRGGPDGADCAAHRRGAGWRHRHRHGRARRAAVRRPPGHHAGPRRPAGQPPDPAVLRGSTAPCSPTGPAAARHRVLIGHGPEHLSYGSYLHLDELLAAQHPVSRPGTTTSCCSSPRTRPPSCGSSWCCTSCAACTSGWPPTSCNRR